jgi:catechol 2,3-dioxygenase-like lactoylglutathione lyase family enzyme
VFSHESRYTLLAPADGSVYASAQLQFDPTANSADRWIGTGPTLGEPGSVKGVQLVVDNIDAVRRELASRGVAVGDVQQLGPEGAAGSRFMFFQDPDGNGWAVQEMKRS